MKKPDRIFGIAQTAVISVLVLSLLTICGMYIYTENSTAAANLPAFPESHMHLLSKDASWTMKSGNSVFISPSFIAVTVDGKSYGGYSDSRIGSEVWSEFERMLLLLDDSDVKKEVFSDKNTAFNHVDALYGKQNKFYCEFSNPLPLSAVAVFFENTYNDSILYKESFFAKAMIITGGESGEAVLSILSENGETITSRPHTAVEFNATLLESHDELGLDSIDFSLINKSRNAGYIGYIPVFDAIKRLHSVQKEDLTDTINIGIDTESTEKILSAFGMNPNNTNRYTAPDGGVGFVENSGQLNITPDCEITFVSDEGKGIVLSKILGYVPSDVGKEGYSFDDTVGALCYILDALGGDMLGNDAGLVLESAIYNNESGSVSFAFAYYLDGVRINTGYDTDALLVFSGNCLIEARIHAARFTDIGDEYGDIQQKASLAVAELSDSAVITGLFYEYKSEESGSVFLPEWTAEYRSNGEIVR